MDLSSTYVYHTSGVKSQGARRLGWTEGEQDPDL